MIKNQTDGAGILNGMIYNGNNTVSQWKERSDHSPAAGIFVCELVTCKFHVKEERT